MKISVDPGLHNDKPSYPTRNGATKDKWV